VLVRWLEAQGYEIKVQTGIRVFHNYMKKDAREDVDLDEMMALE